MVISNLNVYGLIGHLSPSPGCTTPRVLIFVGAASFFLDPCFFGRGLRSQRGTAFTSFFDVMKVCLAIKIQQCTNSRLPFPFTPTSTFLQLFFFFKATAQKIFAALLNAILIIQCMKVKIPFNQSFALQCNIIGSL